MNDKVCQLLWAWFSCQMQSADEILEPGQSFDTRHFSRHNSDDKKMAEDKDETLLCCFIL